MLERSWDRLRPDFVSSLDRADELADLEKRYPPEKEKPRKTVSGSSFSHQSRKEAAVELPKKIQNQKAAVNPSVEPQKKMAIEALLNHRKEIAVKPYNGSREEIAANPPDESQKKMAIAALLNNQTAIAATPSNGFQGAITAKPPDASQKEVVTNIDGQYQSQMAANSRSQPPWWWRA